MLARSTSIFGRSRSVFAILLAPLAAMSLAPTDAVAVAPDKLFGAAAPSDDAAPDQARPKGGAKPVKGKPKAPAPKPKAGGDDKKAKGGGKKKVEIPPDVQRQIDELMEREEREKGKSGAKAGAKAGKKSAAPKQDRPKRPSRTVKRGGAKPAADKGRPSRPGAKKKPTTPPPAAAGGEGDAPTGPTTTINIPPADLPAEDDTAPEDRLYSFSIKNGTYEQLLAGVHRQTGLGILGEAPQDGSVTFVTEEMLSFTEMLSRVRMLLFNYKPHDPYWLRREATHLKVVRVTDLYRELGLDRMFRSVADFRAANLPEEELALVIYTPTGSVHQLQTIRDFMPDYVRIAPLEGRNAITIFALVRDIEKYLQLKDIFVATGGTDDIRPLEVIPVKHVSATDAWTKIQTLMSSTGAPAEARGKASRARGREATSVLNTMPEPAVSVVPDDAQGVLIVRAMQDKIDEIKFLLPVIDVDTGVDNPAVVIELAYATAADIIPVIEQILTASQSSGGAVAAPKRPARSKGKGRGKATATAVTTDSMTLIPHPSGDAIIAIGPDEDVEEVRALVAQFDKKTTLGPLRIEIDHADPEELTAVLTQMMVGPGEGGKGAVASFHIAADPTGGGIWFTGTEKDLEKAREIIALIDVEGANPTLHVITLEKQLPSFVAAMLTEMDSNGGSMPSMPAAKRPGAKKGRKPRKGATATPGGAKKFTPDDAGMRLYALCTEDEWQGYLPIIQQLEDAVPEPPATYVELPVEHIDPADAVEKLKALAGGISEGAKKGGPSMGVRFETTDKTIIVVGATQKDIDKCRELLKVIDYPEDTLQRTFELQYADPETIIGAIQALVIESGNVNRRSPRRAGAKPAGKQAPATVMSTPNVTIVPMGNRLVVRTTSDRMERIAEIIAEFDVEEGTTKLRVYEDFPASADIQGIADTITTLVLGGKPRVRPGGKPAESGEGQAKIIAQPELGRLIVVATNEQFVEIEEVLNVLRVDIDIPTIETEFVDLHFAKPGEVVELVEPILVMKVQELEATGVLRSGAEPGRAAASPGGKKPKAPGRTRGKATSWFIMQADAANRRVAITAPEVVRTIAKTLIGEFDFEAGGELKVVTIEVHNAEPADMVKTIGALMGTPQRGVKAPRGVKGKGKAAASSAGDPSTGGFWISEAPAGRAVVMRGTQELIDQATVWIAEFDALPGGDPRIEIFTLQHVQANQIVDVIMATVDVAPKAQRPGARAGAAKGGRGRTAGPVIEDEDPWTTKIKRTGTDVYLEADLIANTILVSATPPKLAQISGIIKQFDVPDGFPEPPEIPKLTYELKWADPLDAEWNCDSVFETLWVGEEKPRCEAAFFGDFLVIEYPHEDRFPEIEALIAKYIDKKPEGAGAPVRKPFIAPEGMSAREVALLLQMRNPDIEFEVVDRSRDMSGYEDRRVGPSARGASDCVLPGAFHRMNAQLLAAVTAVGSQVEDDDPPPAQRSAEPDEEADAVREFARALLDDAEAGEGAGDEESTEEPPKKKVKVYYDIERRAVIVEGAEDIVEDLEEDIEKIAEEFKELKTGPPNIRVYRVKYIDVHTAANVINEMFNATQQQRQQIMQQQRMAQQRQIQQQRQQQRQQRQQQQQNQGQETPQGRRGQPQQQQQQQANVPQLPPTSVRVYPQPRDRTLILRADESQYPALLELLATIDQPQPIESEFRIFKLEKLNAVEVEELLTSMLGLDQARTGTTRRQQPSAAQRRGGRQTRPRTSSATPTGSKMPKTILQEIEGGGGALGIDPEDINLSSNAEANTLVAMAPVKALDYIGEIIEKLEKEAGPDRDWKTYELKYADVEEVVEYLTSYYSDSGSAASSSRGRAAGGRGGRRGAATPRATSGGSLNAPTFVAYARLKLLSVQATPEQFEEIDTLVTTVDVRGEEGDRQTIALTRADAADVADTLTTIFSEGASAGGKQTRGRRVAPTTTGTGPKFFGKEGGKTVFYTAKEELRAEILQVVAKIEAETPSKEPRVIQLVHAVASDIAEALQAAYGGTSSSRRTAGRRGGASAASSSRLTITAHDASKRLFVIADDPTFEKVQSLAKTMDVAPTMDFKFKIYTLKYADAKKVHEQFSNLIADYIRRLGRGATMEAFSVEVDEKANALIVLGSPPVFGFLEEHLPTIDTPANARETDGILMVALKNANATEVAQNINRLWAGRNVAAGQTPPTAEANRGLNTLIVKGTQSQIDEINNQFIIPLEENVAPSLVTKIFPLQHAQPEAVAEAITTLFENKKRASQTLGRDSNVAPIEFTVAATPNVNTKQVIVQASETNLELITSLIAEMDQEGMASAAASLRVYTVKYADPNAVANIINQWARTRAQSAGRQRNVAASDVVSANAEPATGSVVVQASETNHLIVKEMIDALDDEKNATLQRKQHVLKLQYASAADLANQLGQVFRNAGNRRRGDAGPTFVASPTSNAIMATLNEEELADVTALLITVDVEPSLDVQRVTEVYPLQYADPGSLNAVVLNMFRWDRRAQASPSETVTCAVEWGTRSLIVTANAKNQEVVKAMVEKSDVESTVAKETFFHQLKAANAEDVAQTLQQAYRGRRSTGRGDQPVQITADAPTNSLVIYASKVEMDELQPLITSLDVEPSEELQRQIKAFPLVNAEPANVQDAINQMFRGQSRNPRDQVTAVPEFGGGSVIVSASPENMRRVQELIGQLDTAEGAQKEVHVLTLSNADADSVSRTLNEIFVRAGGRQRGSMEPPISISALQGSKAVLVKCNADDFADIDAVVTELDSDESVGGEVRVVSLKYADATEMQRALQESLAKQGGGRGRGGELLGGVRLSALAGSNALVISGGKDAVDGLEVTVQGLDEAARSGTEPRIIALEHAKVAQILPQLTEMFVENARGGGRGRGQEAPAITADEVGNQLIVRASQTDFSAIEAVVRELDTEEHAERPNFRIVQLSQGINIADLGEKVQEAINGGVAAQYGQTSGRGRGANIPSITVMADARTTSLMISGSAILFDEAEKLAKEMEQLGPAGGLHTTVVTIKNRSADDIQRLIDQLTQQASEGGGSSNRARRGGSTRRSTPTNRGNRGGGNRSQQRRRR